MNTFVNILTGAIKSAVMLIAMLAPYILLCVSICSNWRTPTLNISAIMLSLIFIVITKPITMLVKTTQKTNKDCGLS